MLEIRLFWFLMISAQLLVKYASQPEHAKNLTKTT